MHTHHSKIAAAVPLLSMCTHNMWMYVRMHTKVRPPWDLTSNQLDILLPSNAVNINVVSLSWKLTLSRTSKNCWGNSKGKNWRVGAPVISFPALSTDRACVRRLFPSQHSQGLTTSDKVSSQIDYTSASLSQ